MRSVIVCHGSNPYLTHFRVYSFVGPTVRNEHNYLFNDYYSRHGLKWKLVYNNQCKWVLNVKNITVEKCFALQRKFGINVRFHDWPFFFSHCSASFRFFEIAECHLCIIDSAIQLGLSTMDMQQQYTFVESSKNELWTKKMFYHVLAHECAASRNFLKFSTVEVITREERTNMRQRGNNFNWICCCCNFFATIYFNWFLQSCDILCCTRVAVACSLQKGT